MMLWSTMLPEYVNMSADELEKWLETGDSSSSGWTGEKGDGETVGEVARHGVV